MRNQTKERLLEIHSTIGTTATEQTSPQQQQPQQQQQQQSGSICLVFRIEFHSEYGLVHANRGIAVSDTRMYA
jgi:hypothetical protein